jgi:hypothetical protein
MPQPHGTCTVVACVLAVAAGCLMRTVRLELQYEIRDLISGSHRRRDLQERRKHVLPQHVLPQRYLWKALDQNASADAVVAIFSLVSDGERKQLANSVRYQPHTENEGRTALFVACMNQNAAVVRVLLRNFANASAGRVDEGTTPLHVAVGWRHSSLVVDELLAAPDRKAVRRLGQR